jgi:hypothetical protein
MFLGINPYFTKGTADADFVKSVVVFLARNERNPARTEFMAGLPEDLGAPFGQDLEVP